MKYVFECLESQQLMLFIALTGFPILKLKETFLRSTGTKFGIKAFFKQKNLAWIVAVIVKLRLAKSAMGANYAKNEITLRAMF